MDIRERVLDSPDPRHLEEVIRAAVEAQMREKWSAMPVALVEDSDGKTSKLKVTLKVPVRDEKGQVTYRDLPELHDAPIHFQGGGGVTNTFAIKKADEGLAIFASRAQDAWFESGGIQQAVDTRSHNLSDATLVPGMRAKPRELKDVSTEAAEQRSDDGRHRGITHPRNGIKTSVNGGKQVLDVNAQTGEVELKSLTVTLASGDVPAGRKPNAPNTVDRDLNEGMRGTLARLGQLEKSHAGLFDVLSKLRENTEKVVPALAPVNAATQVTSVLNGSPGGLDAMVALVEGKAPAYLQTQMSQALGMFMNPSIGAVASLLGGGIEGQIEALKGQIANLIANNPVVGQVEDLQRQVDAVLVRGASAAVEASQLGPIQSQIAALAMANPVVGALQALRSKLQSLIGQAGPGLNFLEPQKRLAQGKIKSLHLSE